MPTPSHTLSVLIATVTLASWPGAAHAGSFSDWFEENMIDEQDGKFDISTYLAGATGFFPVPIIITEPAVGAGLGFAVAYFHPPNPVDVDAHPHRGPPSISVGFGAKTENGTNFYGVGHLGVWKDDHVRYLGAVAKADANLRFYPNLGQQGLLAEGIKFNVLGEFLFQQLKFRLRESNWWLGMDYLYSDAETKFFIQDQPIGLPPPLGKFQQGGVGTVVEFDSRDSTFTPSRGLRGKLQYRNYADTWGSDFDFDHMRGSLNYFIPVGEYSSLGLRLDGEAVRGEVPFFSYPFVSLRGIPAMRYQGQEVVTTEVEYLWGLTPRWTVNFFAGAGRTTAVDTFATTDDTVAAGGVGFRYRIARKLRMQVGIDVARGPEETAFYLTVGSAWF